MRVKTKAARNRVKSRLRTKGSAAPTRHNATILIVDGDQAVTELFGKILREDGYAVRTAPSAAVALQEIHTHHPDAILLELLAPHRLDGLGFLRRVRLLDDDDVPSWS